MSGMDMFRAALLAGSLLAAAQPAFAQNEAPARTPVTNNNPFGNPHLDESKRIGPAAQKAVLDRLEAKLVQFGEALSKDQCATARLMRLDYEAQQEREAVDRMTADIERFDLLESGIQLGSTATSKRTTMTPDGRMQVENVPASPLTLQNRSSLQNKDRVDRLLSLQRNLHDAYERMPSCAPGHPDGPGEDPGGNTGWYGSIGAGMAFLTGQKAPEGIGSLGVEASAGPAFNVAIGHDFGTIRAEVQVDWWKNNLRFIRLDGPTIFGLESPGTGGRVTFPGSSSFPSSDLVGGQNAVRTDVATPPVANVVANGSQSELRLMFNLLLDIGDEEGISGYIGGGIGLARTTRTIGLPLFGQPFAPGSDSNTGFAGQLKAGVEIPIDDDISIGIGATYDLGGATLAGSIDDRLSKGDVIADLGLKFSF